MWIGVVATAFSILALPSICEGGPSCGPCNPEACRTPTNCLAGMVKDTCGCCFVCGLREGLRCQHPSVLDSDRYSVCGENLECRLRDDLAPNDPPEALCFCKKREALCGSDGKTYENECQLTEARYRRRDGLRAVSRGPCKAAPKILSPPEDTRNQTGGHAAMSCEVMGWPIPTVEWKVDYGNGDMKSLPTDSPNVAVQSRGGPSAYEVTSWLQLLRVTSEDEATYHCVARNEEGEVSASAKLIITGVTRHRERDETDYNSL